MVSKFLERVEAIRAAERRVEVDAAKTCEVGAAGRKRPRLDRSGHIRAGAAKAARTVERGRLVAEMMARRGCDVTMAGALLGLGWRKASYALRAWRKAQKASGHE